MFHLDTRWYAIPLECVREIHHLVAASPIPDSPAWLLGVINRRGQVIPLVDLRARLGLPPEPARLDAHMMVTEVQGYTLSFVVDEVHDVITIAPGIEHVSRPAELPASLVTGVIQLSGRVIVLLDPAALHAETASALEWS